MQPPRFDPNITEPKTPESGLLDEPIWQERLADSAEGLAAELSHLASLHSIKIYRDIRWKSLLRAFTATCLLGLISGLVLKSTGWLDGMIPANPVVAFVPVSGLIEPGGKASAEVLVPLIKKACADTQVKILVLHINSPGGHASEAERINDAIAQCKLTADGRVSKKVFSVLDGMAASAAYMIAMKSDRIYSGKYTMVGSIGSIIRYQDLTGLAERWGIRERTFKSSALKGGISMLSESSPQEDAANQALVDDIGRIFLLDVLEHRKGKLKIDKAELYSGRIWTGEQAMTYGLVDAIATRESLETSEFKNLDARNYGPKNTAPKPTSLRDFIDSNLLSSNRLHFQ